MARKRKIPIKEARHVRLYMSMTKTHAWRDLNCYARAGYFEISSRYGGPDSNNGRIPYSGREMAANLKLWKGLLLGSAWEDGRVKIGAAG